MALITNYATLQTAVADYLARDDLTTFVPNFIENAERKLHRVLNLRNEETALSVSISGGVATVPTDFKALKFAYFAGSPVTVLQWVPLESLYRDNPNRSGAHTPCQISREGANFVFGPNSKDGTLTGIYYARQDRLATTDGSWYVLNAPDVLLYGALLEAQPFIVNDERIPIWQGFFKDAVDTLRTENGNAEVSMGQLIQQTAQYA